MGLLHFFRKDYGKLLEDLLSADLRTRHGQELLKRLRASGSGALAALRDTEGRGSGRVKPFDRHLEPERFSEFWRIAISAEITKRVGGKAFGMVIATLGDGLRVRRGWAESVLLYMGGMWRKGESLKDFQPLDFGNRMWQEAKQPLIDYVQGGRSNDDDGCVRLLASIASANDVEPIVERVSVGSARTFGIYLDSVSGVDDKVAFRRRYQELLKNKEATQPR